MHSIPGSRVSAAHIHMGTPTATLAQSKLVYTFPAGFSPIRGQVILDRTMAEALYLGNLYVNIHTSAAPGGELRGKWCICLFVWCVFICVCLYIFIICLFCSKRNICLCVWVGGQ